MIYKYTMEFSYPITYLYKLYDNNGEIFYIGKTLTPKTRFYVHSRSKWENIQSFTFEIYKEYIDEEHIAIIDFYNKGARLNQFIPTNSEGKFNVGDKFETHNVYPQNYIILDKYNNITFYSLKECAKYYNISIYNVKNSLTKIENNTYNLNLTIPRPVVI